MTTAQWMLVIAGLGLAITLIGFIVKLVIAITRLTVTMENFNKQFCEDTATNRHEHDDLWGKVEQHDEKLSNHAERIGILENKPPRKRTA